VHGVNGAWGCLALGLFADGTYGGGWNGVGYNSYLPNHPGVTGLLYGDPKQFVVQLIGVTTCIVWNVVVAGTIFWLIGKVLGGNRVPPEVEIAGLDIPEMGAPGYPEFITPMAPENVPQGEVRDAKAKIPQFAPA
jgi:Amt family ammonium transporter